MPFRIFRYVSMVNAERASLSFTCTAFEAGELSVLINVQTPLSSFRAVGAYLSKDFDSFNKQIEDIRSDKGFSAGLYSIDEDVILKVELTPDPKGRIRFLICTSSEVNPTFGELETFNRYPTFRSNAFIFDRSYLETLKKDVNILLAKLNN